MAVLGKNYADGNQPVSNSKLAALSDVKEPYLEKIMAKLKSASLVSSIMGQNGGYVLQKQPNEITVGAIIRQLEGDVFISDCVAKDCKNKNCLNKSLFTFIYNKINSLLDSMTLEDIINRNI